MLLLLGSLAIAALLVLLGLSIGPRVATGAALLASKVDEVLGVADVECLVHGLRPCAVLVLALVLATL